MALPAASQSPVSIFLASRRQAQDYVFEYLKKQNLQNEDAKSVLVMLRSKAEEESYEPLSYYSDSELRLLIEDIQYILNMKL